MKTRLIVITILLLVLAVLLSRNDERISNILLEFINPVKQNYKQITNSIKEKGQSYLYQQESIERLNKENRNLKKRLLEQTHYIRQIKDVYRVLPQLNYLPAHNVSIVQTISYIKLNSFSQINLTQPLKLKENKLYGLIQGKVVGGTAKLHHKQLNGYLTSDPKCRFSVFIGKKHAPGIAIGLKENTMIVKFIPKWHKINVGDKVVTSGLDQIFYEGIPVGKVAKVETQSSYKVAYIKTYDDVYHPKTFFLINDASVSLANKFDSNKTVMAMHSIALPDTEENNNSFSATYETNNTSAMISSIPSRIDQTQEVVIEPEVPQEMPPKEKIKKPNPKRTMRNSRKKQSPKKVKKRSISSTIDLF